MNKTYAVFGLGRYGMAVAKELVNHGKEVLAVDIDPSIVNSAVIELPFCKCADITDPEVAKQLGVADIDIVIIAMASNIEASVMAVMLCKELGVKTVIAKCGSEMHRKILLKVGADKVVFPENESGIRLAKNMLSAGFIDVFDVSNDVSIIELAVRDEWIGKSLVELNLRKKLGVNIIAIRHSGNMIINIDPYMQLSDDMQLLVITNTSNINKLK